VKKAGLIALLVLLPSGYLATGLVFVAPGEVAVVQRLGRFLRRPWGPGPHLGWPAGFDRVALIETDRVRRIEVGTGDEPGAGEYLTGDRNLVRARAIVQYRVADPLAFARQGEVIDSILQRHADAALGRALARSPIDESIGAGRVRIAQEAASVLARDGAALGLGVAVLGVSLTDVRPPLEVEPDFAAAQNARTGRAQRLNEAKAEAARTRIAAEAEAGRRLDHARAQAERAVTLSGAQAQRFHGLLDEARRSRRLTVQRLYLDALRDLLPRIRRKVLLTPDEPLDFSLYGAEPTR
jgi:membrane protease subunit HflK